MNSKELAFLKGRNSAGLLGKMEFLQLFDYIERLESLLDSTDEDNVFGIEGWRHFSDNE